MMNLILNLVYHVCSIVRKLGFDYVQSDDETNNKKPTLVKIKQ